MKDKLSGFGESNRGILMPDKNFLKNLKDLLFYIKNSIDEVVFSVNNTDSDIGPIKAPILEENILKYLKELEEYKDKFFRVGRIWEDGKIYIIEVGIRCNEDEEDGNPDFSYYDISKIKILKEKLSEIK